MVLSMAVPAFFHQKVSKLRKIHILRFAQKRKREIGSFDSFLLGLLKIG